MKFYILPYIEIDGIRTLTNSQVMGIYDQMECDGSLRWVFFQGGIKSREDFLTLMKSDDHRFYAIVNESNTIVAIFWMNSFEMKLARLHFNVFNHAWAHTDKIMKVGMEYLYNLKDANNNTMFTRFLGILPTCNISAVKFLVRNGGTIVGTVPDLYWDHIGNKSVEGTILYF